MPQGNSNQPQYHGAGSFENWSRSLLQFVSYLLRIIRCSENISVFLMMEWQLEEYVCNMMKFDIFWAEESEILTFECDELGRE